MRAPILGAFAVLLAACGGAPAIPASPPPAEAAAQEGEMSPQPAMKGMELYSWSTREGGDDVFYYALTFGTNRAKDLAEIQARPLTLAQIKEEISRLPSGESLSWSNQVADPKTGEWIPLPLPPAETIEEILQVARARQIDLWVEGHSEP
jgi:hypothetical protein